MCGNGKMCFFVVKMSVMNYAKLFAFPPVKLVHILVQFHGKLSEFKLLQSYPFDGEICLWVYLLTVEFKVLTIM